MKRSGSARTKHRRSPRPSRILQAAGWTDTVREALESLIVEGSGKGLPIVFDFDNTLVCGDIGEATLAVLAKSGGLDTAKLPQTFFPAFKSPGRGLVTLADCADVADYYEAFLAPTVHGEQDSAPNANGYTLAVEIMTGLNPFQIVQATKQAYEMARPGEVRLIEVSPGITAYPAPFFYPEMVEFLARLIQHKFDVWIVSASNVWSVRWMILKALPPLLRRHGVSRTIPPDRVVGISTLLSDPQRRLFKDQVLVRDRRAYATLTKSALTGLQLTSRLSFPVPTYSGKIACIMDQIGRPPHLCAGDSPGDLPMMSFSEHRLWMARLEKLDYQRAAIDTMSETNSARWLVQPTLTKNSPGFLPNAAQLATRLSIVSPPVKASLALWQKQNVAF
ncbi:MAG: hypothetical protein AB9869_00425 [Verrucomicrobiia bacterium]